MPIYHLKQKSLGPATIALCTALVFTISIEPALATYGNNGTDSETESSDGASDANTTTTIDINKLDQLSKSIIENILHYRLNNLDTTNQSGSIFARFIIGSMYSAPSLTERLIRKLSRISDPKARKKYLKQEIRKIRREIESATRVKEDLRGEQSPQSGSLLLRAIFSTWTGEIDISRSQKPDSEEVIKVSRRIHKLSEYLKLLHHWEDHPGLEQPN